MSAILFIRKYVSPFTQEIHSNGTGPPSLERVGALIVVQRWVDGTYTLAAHRVTFRPSFKQSSSPLPPASVLHTM